MDYFMTTYCNLRPVSARPNLKKLAVSWNVICWVLSTKKIERNILWSESVLLQASVGFECCFHLIVDINNEGCSELWQIIVCNKCIVPLKFPLLSYIFYTVHFSYHLHTSLGLVTYPVIHVNASAFPWICHWETIIGY